MIEWIISSSLLILVVLVLRAAMGKRISAGLRYGLWAVVLVRLLVPVSFLAVTVPQLPVWEPPEAMLEKSIYILPVDSAPAGEAGIATWADGSIVETDSFGHSRLDDSGKKVVRYADRISPLELLGWVWIAGAASLGTVLAASNLRFIIRLRRVRRPLEGTSAPIPVYVAAGLPSPCLIGLLHPAIYVTEEAANTPAMLRHVLAHELTHYNHLDHLWSVLRGAALAVHWWNPLVWLAVVCSRRDGELACDEGALERLGDGERTAYGETLLALVTAKSRPGDLLSFATTMTGGKRSLKERIQRIACRPKRLVSAMIVVVAVLVLSSVVAFGQATETPDPETVTDPAEKTPQGIQADLDHDGQPDTLEILEFREGEHTSRWELRFTASDMSVPAWTGEALTPHVGWTAFFLCRMDGEDYLLQYTPWMGGGSCDYSYKLFYLTASGEEVVVQENSVEFDLIFAPDYVARHQYNPRAINTFMEEINALLESSEQLLNTDENLLGTFEKEGRLYDSVWWMDDVRDENRTLLENLILYQDKALEESGGQAADLPVTVDLDHDGIPDEMVLRTSQDPLGFSYDGTMWTLECDLSGGGAWETEGQPSLPGCNAVFLYQMDGEDYLLLYVPEFWHGMGTYEYRLFYLDGGREVVVQENAVTFDVKFHEDSVFDPEEIAAFMEEINALLAGSTQLVNTNLYLQGTFDSHGRLYDDLYWLDDWREDGLSLLEVLQNYGTYCGDHPDDAWSPLADLLQDLTEADILAFNGDQSALVDLLKGAERGSRFYTWESYSAAYDGHGVDDYNTGQWELSMADGSTLYLIASSQSDNVLIILEASRETVSAFYSVPELNEWIRSEVESPMAED